MQELKYLKPLTIEEAVSLKSDYGKEGRILAGGTDLIIALKDRALKASAVIDIKAIEEFHSIDLNDEVLTIGGAVTLNEIIDYEAIGGEFQILKDAAKTHANKLLRNRATLAGNICNASPGGDMLPASLVLDGSVELVSKTGKRIIPLKDFFTGVKKTVLKDDEILVRTLFPRKSGRGIFKKKSRIKGHDLAQVSAAGYISGKGDFKFAVGAAAPIPMLMDNLGVIEDICRQKNQIIGKIMSSINPIDDVRASKEYRIAMVRYLSGQIIDELGGM